MKVTIKNVEKTNGLVFKKILYGVELTVLFTEEERAIIKSRNLTRMRIMDRDWSAEVDGEAREGRGLMSKVTTAVISGLHANSPHLIVGGLLRGPDTYYLNNLAEAKIYTMELRERLQDMKDMITANAVCGADESFEL